MWPILPFFRYSSCLKKRSFELFCSILEGNIHAQHLFCNWGTTGSIVSENVMRKTIITLIALATTGIATAAQAGETYVGASGGINLQNDSKNKGRTTADIPATADFPAIASGTSVDWKTRFKNGYDLNLMAGHRFDNGFRVELQGFYNEANVSNHTNLAVGGTVIDGLDSAVLTRGAANAANPTVGTVLSTDDGKLKNYGVFANAFYDIKAGENFMPYVGVGAGLQREKVKFIPSGVPVANDSKTVFAYQAMAGATYKLSPSLEVFGQYTYRMADRAKVDLTLLPAELGVRSKQSIVNFGVRIPFGGSSE
jgi:opacity protein-like surface antigen